MFAISDFYGLARPNGNTFISVDYEELIVRRNARELLNLVAGQLI